MTDRTYYLNFFDGINTPTDEDFFDYFIILTLLLQEEADKGRWNNLKPENLKAYDKTNDGILELGSKLEYDYKSFVYEFGVRFQVKSSVGYYSLFFNLLPLWQNAAKCIVSQKIEELEADVKYDCSICNERIICNSIYSITEQIIESIGQAYKNCRRTFNEEEELIGVEIRLGGDPINIYNQSCEFLDLILPLLIKFRPTEAPGSSAIITSPSYTELYDALLPYTSSFYPSFKIFKRCQETIEEIYNRPHGIDCEYLEEEPPF